MTLLCGEGTPMGSLESTPFPAETNDPAEKVTNRDWAGTNRARPGTNRD